jgi:hypothetical protein
MHEIKKNREKFIKENPYDVIIDSMSFMILIDKYMFSSKNSSKNSSKIYLWSDNPSCGFLGLYDIDDYKTHYCPIEDFTDEEMKKIDNCKKFLYNITRSLRCGGQKRNVMKKHKKCSVHGQSKDIVARCQGHNDVPYSSNRVYWLREQCWLPAAFGSKYCMLHAENSQYKKWPN